MAVVTNSLIILSALSVLFYVSKFLGILSYDFFNYYNHKSLRKSSWGNAWVVICAFCFFAQYHLIINYTFIPQQAQNTSSLTMAIGLFITYMGPMMMVVDQAIGLYNQQDKINLFVRIEILDENLTKQCINVSNAKVRTSVNLGVAIVFTGELISSLSNVLMVKHDSNAYFLVFMGIPILISTLEKLWFVALTVIIRDRFFMINQQLRDSVKTSMGIKPSKGIFSITHSSNISLPRKEIFRKNSRLHHMEYLVPDGNDLVRELNIFGEKSVKMKQKCFTKTEVQLSKLCELHDEICEIAKKVNNMWSLQMLFLLAYGFMSITAQFYFLYCFLANQNYPPMFMSAGSITSSMIFIIYTAVKCIFVIYISWKTKLESQNTGVLMHEVGNTIDDNGFYEIVNHISLKLLSHSINFTACGFFNLDMTTVYSITGAITTYLIILIQFNLAAHQT